ncbi:hypothetical protein LWI28_026133 [Acer negundo]|uniref:Uncharacterized protein n=1 Tax=Acer negundo TaxID=4023 RepID=A0AAD5ISE1_ACENE|nr:hypothetical protein LWI28_026133 [Acer negundo]KAK4842915.1 hypothetical protein QYF36_001556 [Acer negundo]
MAPNKKSDDGSANNKQVIIRSDKGAWTAEEDRKLSEYIETHGAKRWKTIATKSGLNRCGKSCRLRWLNYLRPNIKRGNISDEEEDLILRLHKLLGNRWALIAGRLPGRTDNEIKNYWNSHLSKKISHEKKISRPSAITEKASNITQVKEEEGAKEFANSGLNLDIDIDDFFDFSTEGCYGLDWVNKFPELDDLDSSSWLTDKRFCNEARSNLITGSKMA